MSRRINIQSLKRKSKIKKIDLHDNQAPIEIEINPSEDIKEQIVNSLINNSTTKKKNNNEDIIGIDISDRSTFLLATKLISDIELQQNEEKDFLECIYDDPNQYGIELKNVILSVINKIVLEYFSDQIIAEKGNVN